MLSCIFIPWAINKNLKLEPGGLDAGDVIHGLPRWLSCDHQHFTTWPWHWWRHSVYHGDWVLTIAISPGGRDAGDVIHSLPPTRTTPQLCNTGRYWWPRVVAVGISPGNHGAGDVIHSLPRAVIPELLYKHRPTTKNMVGNSLCNIWSSCLVVCFPRVPMTSLQGHQWPSGEERLSLFFLTLHQNNKMCFNLK